MMAIWQPTASAMMVSDGKGGTSTATVDVTINGVTDQTGGNENLSVRLAGQWGANAGDELMAPHYQIYADGVLVDEGDVTWGPTDGSLPGDDDWRTLSFEVDNGGKPIDEVEVRFTNDAYDAGVSDRNLLVDYIETNGARFEAEAPETSYEWIFGAPLSGRELMPWEGGLVFDTSDPDITDPITDHTVSVRLAGQSGANAGEAEAAPHYEIYAENVLIASGDVDWADSDGPNSDADWRILNFNFDLDVETLAGVEVHFTNDAYDPGVSDRNMFVDYVEIDGTRVEAEDPRTVYERTFGVIEGQETMAWEGRLIFENPADAIV